eukprot:scaffold918_cov126-Cylindrotheca_fusiformis.AAC.28
MTETNLTLEKESLCSIEAMFHREKKSYSIPDYFRKECAVAPRHRRKIAEWCLYLADYVGFSQISVEMAMNCLDRFAGTEIGRRILRDTLFFERATLTALYTIVKCNEDETLTLKDVEEISRSKHLEEEIESMEMIMLMALDWNVNPPSASCYVQKFLGILHIADEKKELIADLASCQLETAIQDFDISMKGSFCIAHAATLNAMVLVKVNQRVWTRFQSRMAPFLHTTSKSAQASLREELLKGVPSDLLPTIEPNQTHSHGSPRSVTDRSLPVEVRSALEKGPGRRNGIKPHYC